MSALSIFSKNWLNAFRKLGESSSVGDVRSSFLSEAQFQSLNGTNWILSDGRSVTGSAFHTVTGLTTVPDCRGVGLRGKNNGRSDGNQDVAGERALGSFQMDALQGHMHDAQVTINTGTGVPDNDSLAQGNGNNSGGSSSNTGVKGMRTSTTPNYGTVRPAAETRVKNIAVNFFVRIN